MATDADAAVTTITQDSPLLKLAAELRNTIYEYAVQDTKLVSYRQCAVLYNPALAQVCRQVREEYKGIYKDGAPRYADEIEILVTDFTFHDFDSTIEVSLHRKHEGLAPATYRYQIVHICIVLTNAFGQSLGQLRNTLPPTQQQPAFLRGVLCDTDCRYRFVFDHSLLDMEFVKHAVNKEINRIYAHAGATRFHRYRKWKRIEQAFIKAVESL
ncbi:hypothetical protein LTR17_001199 [Elasticomyces elasticus]|nr:hypothetical protein LTR17_001199 [Elasticomyces elasticus]